MVMILFESPAVWNLHIISLLWVRGEQNRRGGGGGGSLLVKAAEQKGKAINSGLVCVCVKMPRKSVFTLIIHKGQKTPVTFNHIQ